MKLSIECWVPSKHSSYRIFPIVIADPSRQTSMHPSGQCRPDGSDCRDVISRFSRHINPLQWLIHELHPMFRCRLLLMLLLRFRQSSPIYEAPVRQNLFRRSDMGQQKWICQIANHRGTNEEQGERVKNESMSLWPIPPQQYTTNREAHDGAYEAAEPGGMIVSTAGQVCE
jgi:hypothetical protein